MRTGHTVTKPPHITHMSHTQQTANHTHFKCATVQWCSQQLTHSAVAVVLTSKQCTLLLPCALPCPTVPCHPYLLSLPYYPLPYPALLALSYYPLPHPTIHYHYLLSIPCLSNPTLQSPFLLYLLANQPTDFRQISELPSATSGYF